MTPTWQPPGPSAVSAELDCFGFSRHWMKPSKLHAGCRPTEKQQRELSSCLSSICCGHSVMGVPRLCKVCTWADPCTLHTVLFPKTSPKSMEVEPEQMQDDTLGLRIAAASHPEVLSYNQLCFSQLPFPLE